nr:SRPBCC domain-containing protein [Pseudoxanthomonas sp.]
MPSSSRPVPATWQERIHVDAPIELVWRVLTDPAHMSQWMGEPEMRVTVETDWHVGGSIAIRGFHHVAFENRGVVLVFEPPHALGYHYLSSLSRLADEPGNHTHLRFELAEEDGGTTLALTAHGFATDAIFHHTAFYWAGTLHVLKAYAERPGRE